MDFCSMDLLQQDFGQHGQHGQRHNQRRLVAHIELGKHAVQLIADRGRRYAMASRNFLVAQATSGQACHRAFGPGQLPPRRALRQVDI